MKRHCPRACQWSLGVLGLSVAMAGVYLLALMGTDNMHATIPAELYRSAQLNEASLERYNHSYRFGSIINLRGENAGTPWYDNEKRFAQRHDIDLINFRMSSKQELTRPQVQQLIALMKDAPKPVLIHCRQGADRTGLAVALYMAALHRADEETAEAQLSLRYGHIPWISAAKAMDVTFEAMEPMLGYLDS